MQDYVVNLKSPVSKSFMATKAANSVALNPEKKSEHNLKVTADITSDYKVGLILGASGSGKTTLAKSIFGASCFDEILDPGKPVIDQFPVSYSYDDRVASLTGIGLTSIPCWIRVAATLSNGQKARAEAALQIAQDKDTIVIDEWTSVVNREVGKVMSHAIQKHARKTNKKIVLLSCHYDVVDWLNPDWIIDCNTETYKDRRSMVGSHKRTDQLRFDIKRCETKQWKYFSKYHYLSETLPSGKVLAYGLYHGSDQIGFTCFANYSWNDKRMMHSNRVVIHPDYIGLGLGIQLATEASQHMHSMGYIVKAKFTSVAMYKLRKNHPRWICRDIKRHVTKKSNGEIPYDIKTKCGIKKAKDRNKSKLHRVTYFYFDYRPPIEAVSPREAQPRLSK